MAQLVKLEPGDVLVLANVGEESASWISDAWPQLKAALGIEEIIVFAGEADLSKLPTGWAPDAVAGG